MQDEEANRVAESRDPVQEQRQVLNQRSALYLTA